MEIKEYSNYKEDEILRLYNEVGWIAYTEKPEVLEQGYKNSLLVLAAYEKDELLGIIRVVGDGHTIVFVQDILVFPNYQRKGIGTALLKAVLYRYLKSGRLSWLRIILLKRLPSISHWALRSSRK